MSSSVSILIVDLADETFAAVGNRLRSFARDHLIDDLVIVDVNTVTSTETPAAVAGTDQEEDELYAVLGRRSIATARVCAVAHSGMDGTETTTVADEIFTNLKELSPPGTRLKSVRIWAGDDEAEYPSSYASPAIDANLVVIPEDRASGVQFGVPIRDVRSTLFVESLAVEIATQLGLWIGMSGAPVDDATLGVIGYGSAKIYFVRSFVRIAAGPSVPIAPILVD
ncbi:MAG: hypothetical protein M3132_05710, partial [Actinomycetia bacterium]|nr:hypothetical protein [Actinomycetes bacterium]